MFGTSLPPPQPPIVRRPSAFGGGEGGVGPDSFTPSEPGPTRLGGTPAPVGIADRRGSFSRRTTVMNPPSRGIMRHVTAEGADRPRD
jgi:hypothetical protein